jgi:hypothetical protein
MTSLLSTGPYIGAAPGTPSPYTVGVPTPVATTGASFMGSHLPPIQETGMKGYLKWLQREQPEVYKVMAPQLPVIAPAAFSHYTQSVATTTRTMGALASLRRRNRGRFPGTMGGLGHFSALNDTSSGTGDLFQPDFLSTPSFDTSSDVQETITAAQGATLDTADAANSTGSTPTQQTTAIAQLAAGVTGLALFGEQASQANAINQLQLQRAAAGLSPLNIGMNANGIPTITGLATSSGTIILLLAVAAGAFLLFGSKKAS